MHMYIYIYVYIYIYRNTDIQVYRYTHTHIDICRHAYFMSIGSQVRICNYPITTTASILSMAVVHVVDSLQELLKVLEDAPKVTRGDCCQWMSVQLTGLSLRDNGHRSAQHHWACVQVTGLRVDGQTYSLSARLDAHITLGSWNKTGPDSSWCRYFARAQGRLANIPMLDMEMRQNSLICSEKHLIFNFMVHSQGGSTLHSSSQTLNACGLKQSERPARGMSPPGQVFHLSVYDFQAW